MNVTEHFCPIIVRAEFLSIGGVYPIQRAVTLPNAPFIAYMYSVFRAQSIALNVNNNKRMKVLNF